MKPNRIQRKRTERWRMPPNTVYVDYGSKWSSPYKIGDKVDGFGVITPQQAVDFYYAYVKERLKAEPDFLDELKGKNLCCRCALDKPCHADVLLELANEIKNEQ